MSGMKDLLGDTPYENYIPAYQPHSATSFEAAKSISSRSLHDRERVLEYLRSHPDGATDEQMVDALQINGSTLRPRRIELQNRGLVVDSKRYALTRSNRRATVWILKPQSDQVTFSTLMPPI